MSLTAPSQSNDYQVTSHKVKPTWNAVIGEINQRVKTIEAATANLNNLVSDAALATSQAVVDDTMLPILSQLQVEFAALSTNIGLAEDSLQALQSGGVSGANVAISGVDGLDAENTQAAIAELLALLQAETEARNAAQKALAEATQTAINNSGASYASVQMFS